MHHLHCDVNHKTACGRLWSEISKQGWNHPGSNEPSSFEPEVRLCMERLCLRAVAEGAVSEPKGAALLRVSVSELDRRLMAQAA